MYHYEYQVHLQKRNETVCELHIRNDFKRPVFTSWSVVKPKEKKIFYR